MKNLFDDIIIDKDKEEFTKIIKNKSITIERIVSNGQKSLNDFWYEQEENEFIVLLQGEASLEFEDKTLALKVGDFYNILKGVKHRVTYTSLEEPTIWLAIFYK